MYSLCKCVVILILSMLCVQVHAQPVDTWPSQPVNIIAPIDAGSAHDAITRRLATELAGIWKQPVRVTNQPGAAGVIGTQAIINSDADAYTIGSINTLFTGVLASRPNASFSRNVVSGVTMFARQNFIIFANKNVPFDNVKQMIAYSKSNPDKLVYASPGIGSYVHLTMEHLSSMQGLSMIHAPYRGIMQAAPDVVGGRVQLLITINNSGLEGLVVKGDLKVIGSLGENATYLGTVVQSLPDVVPGISAYGYYALIVPRGVSQSKIDRIQMDVSNIVARPEFRQQMLDMGLIPYNMPSKEFDRWIDHEVARLKQIIKKSQIKIE